MSFQSKLDSFVESFSRVFDRNASTQQQLSVAGAVAVALAGTYFTLPSFDRKTLPSVKKAPTPSKGKEGEPYPLDIFPGGNWLDTPVGRIRYYEFGPPSSSAKGHIVLVHGITTPQPWRALAPALTEAGYRVLSFDLPGRGLSDSPRVPHDTHLFMSVMTYLLAGLPEWPTKFHLLGMSLGGGIVANFAHYFPQRVDKLILMCPAGATPKNSLRPTARLFGSAYLAYPLMEAMARTLPLGLPLSSANPLVAWQARNHPGFFYSFLSSYRSGPIFDQTDVFKQVIKAGGGKVSAIWGDGDTVVPMRSLEHLGEEGEMLRKNLSVVPGGDHFIVVTRPKETAEAVLKHLAS